MIDAIAGYVGVVFLYMLLFRIIDIKAKRAKEKRRNEVAWNWHKIKGKERQIDNKHYRTLDEEGGTRGVLIVCEINAKVVILSVDVPDEDRNYYLGKQIIAAETEVYK